MDQKPFERSKTGNTSGDGRITLGDIFRMKGLKGHEAEKALREKIKASETASALVPGTESSEGS
jgi:hypothetical protein